MKNTRNTLFISTITALLLSTTATAYAGGFSLMDMDADKNGSVSEQEFNTAKAKRIAAKTAEGRKMRGLANAPTFATIDINKDGKLTSDEIEKMQQMRGKRGKGNNMRQGRGEGNKGMGRPPRPIFADFDANQDQSLTKKEFYDARNKRIGERAKEGRKMKGLANIASFEDLDTNKDNKVSEQEFSGFVMKHEKESHKHQE